FQDQGVNLADVNSVSIGIGTRGNMTPGGSGKMYFDDIHLYRPRYIPGKGTPIASDITADGVVDYRDLETLAGDWLTNDSGLAADLNVDNTIDFNDYAILADQWLDEQLWPEW
ncbi:MAG: hypothetical protein ACYTFW_14670, partial [Planctomycetota bacterium]